MNPNNFIHIKSSKFPVLPSEDDEVVNEGMYGKALSQYLETELKKKGYSIPFICCEDWGWWVDIKGQPFSLGVCVYGASGLKDDPGLCVTVGQTVGRRWSWKKFKFIDKTERVTQLFSDLCAIFKADDQIEIIGYPEDFPFDYPSE
jgi:hypothetical protein